MRLLKPKKWWASVYRLKIYISAFLGAKIDLAAFVCWNQFNTFCELDCHASCH